LMRGQSTFTHRWIAASSRSRARRSGFWGLQPSLRSTRPIWSTWYRTPNSRRTMAGTRGHVQSGVVNPAASAPRSNTRSSLVRRRALSAVTQ
jgi:hypothetical protein